jgi:hypothetical protein
MPQPIRWPVGFQNTVMWLTWRFLARIGVLYAARWYSLISGPAVDLIDSLSWEAV